MACTALAHETAAAFGDELVLCPDALAETHEDDARRRILEWEPEPHIEVDAAGSVG